MTERSVLLHGDCLEQLKSIADASVEAVVTDPPYGLGDLSSERVAECIKAWAVGEVYSPSGRGFMGKDWDAWVPGPEIWKEVFRVLKPGGHLLVFAGTRTQDLMGLSLRLSGFEIRDTLQWIYGTGFPKSQNISKEIDKRAGALKVVGKGRADKNALGQSSDESHTFDITEPNSDEARAWAGWGTALKPAYEPIIMARKPIDGTVVHNTLTHGCGGLNIDATRVATADNLNGGAYAKNATGRGGADMWTSSRKADINCFKRGGAGEYDQPSGRFPTNIILSHAEGCEFQHPGEESAADWACVEGCPIRTLDEQSGVSKSMGGRIGNKQGVYAHQGAVDWAKGHTKGDPGFGDVGGASRFFYCAKASRAERDIGLEGHATKTGAELTGRQEGSVGLSPYAGTRGSTPRANTHPTVKPLDLMRYLVRLVTPRGARVLDPFMGSGTTGCAAMQEGFNFIGIEREAEYINIARSRIGHFMAETEAEATTETATEQNGQMRLL